MPTPKLNKYAFRKPCDHCSGDGRGQTELAAVASLNRHLRLYHGISAGYEGQDAYKRHHAERLALEPRKRRGLESVITPRGTRHNFDASGVLELLALTPRKRQRHANSGGCIS